MKAPRKDLATFTIILEVFSLVLTASVLGEKAHGEHLPERSSRATGEAIIASGFPVGILILLSAVSGFVTYQNRYRTRPGSISSYGQPGCSAGNAFFVIQWPMRRWSLRTSVYC